MSCVTKSVLGIWSILKNVKFASYWATELTLDTWLCYLGWDGNDTNPRQLFNLIKPVERALAEPLTCYIHFTCPSKDHRPIIARAYRWYLVSVFIILNQISSIMNNRSCISRWTWAFQKMFGRTILLCDLSEVRKLPSSFLSGTLFVATKSSNFLACLLSDMTWAFGLLE